MPGRSQPRNEKRTAVLRGEKKTIGFEFGRRIERVLRGNEYPEESASVARERELADRLKCFLGRGKGFFKPNAVWAAQKTNETRKREDVRAGGVEIQEGEHTAFTGTKERSCSEQKGPAIVPGHGEEEMKKTEWGETVFPFPRLKKTGSGGKKTATHGTGGEKRTKEGEGEGVWGVNR